MSDSLPAPGWYPDPAGAQLDRWWSGRDWTEYTQARAAQPAVAPDGWYPDSGRERLWQAGQWTEQWRDTTATPPEPVTASTGNEGVDEAQSTPSDPHGGEALRTRVNARFDSFQEAMAARQDASAEKQAALKTHYEERRAQIREDYEAKRDAIRASEQATVPEPIEAPDLSPAVAPSKAAPLVTTADKADARLAERAAREALHEQKRAARLAKHEARAAAREEHREAREAAHAARELAKRHERWANELALVQSQLDVVERPATDADGALLLRRGESVYLIITGASLVGWVPGARQWVGQSAGFSIPIGHTGIRYRTGASRGHVVQAPPHEAAIDVGTFVATNQRAAFVGGRQTREWPYAKLVNQQIDANGHMVLSSSSRKQPDELSFGSGHSDWVSFRMTAALAAFNGTTDELRTRLQARITSLTASEPREEAETAGAGSPTVSNAVDDRSLSATTRYNLLVNELSRQGMSERERNRDPRVIELRKAAMALGGSGPHPGLER